MKHPMPWSLIGLAAAPFLAQAQDPAAQSASANSTVRIAQASSSSARPTGAAADARAERYGSAARGMPYDREIRLGTDTKSVGVWRRETINFITADGRDFRWRFDTERYLDVFPLERIAPADVAVPAGATVYVNGELPISGDH
jgi:hypothetical protein